MSQSKLVNYTKLSPHCTKPRQGKIKGISIHTMAGPGSVEGCGQVFQQRKASSHYGIGPDGRIGQYVLEENRAWCTSHKVDHELVTIEVSSIQSYKEPYECTKKAYVALINLCVDICKRNGIKKLIWKEGKQYCPAFTGNWAVCNMVPHRYTRPDKSCPGNYLFSKYGEIAAEVNKRLQATTKPVEEVEEDMDIKKIIEQLTPEMCYGIMAEAMNYADKISEPDWSKKEGHWAKATSVGLVNGEAPERPLRRDEFIAVMGRKGLI